LLKIQKNLATKIEKILFEMDYDLTRVLFVTDQIIWQKNQHFFSENFNKKFTKFLILENPQADENFVNKIIENTQNCDLILGFGSGTINDLCKYSSKKLNLNYAILISALSMNGYASKNASITINNHKKTLEAQLPKAILCDLTILKNAPQNLNQAGLADVLCFYSCNFDLLLSNEIFLQEINFEALKIQQKIVKNFVKNYQKFSLNDDKFLRHLLKMILTSGFAMTIANSSAPASQSEHLLAHVLTMKYPQKTQNILHGRMIASTTIFSLINQEKIVKNFQEKTSLKILENLFENLKNENFEKKIKRYFGDDLAQECLQEYNLKKEYLLKNSAKIIDNFKKNNAKIIKILDKNLFKNHLLIEIFNHFAVDFDFKKIGFEDNEINDSGLFAKYIRNRITSSDFE
jgi:glycerol-1-phosphate dehydrogenase [NAD(P)+]